MALNLDETLVRSSQILFFSLPKKMETASFFKPPSNPTTSEVANPMEAYASKLYLELTEQYFQMTKVQIEIGTIASRLRVIACDREIPPEHAHRLNELAGELSSLQRHKQRT